MMTTTPAEQPTNGRRAMRWTEHGPEPVGPDPVAVEAGVAAEAVAAEAVAAEPAVVVASVATTRRPAVRWTEHGPEPVAPDGPSDRDALLARLAERGLVRQEPSPRILDLTGEPPTRPPVEPAHDEVVPVAVPDDAEHLEAEPIGPTSAVACPSCRSSQQVSTAASGYRCLGCQKVWRWAICAHCAALSLTLARQESWRCAPCGDHSRSWWRTVGGRREGPTIVMRRHADEAARQRALASERARRRRWKVVVPGAVLIAATAAWSLVLSDRDVPEVERGPTGAVCSTVADLRAAFGSGTTPPAEVRRSLDALAMAANDAVPEVRVAAQRWAASGQPGDATFVAAADDVATACTGVSP